MTAAEANGSGLSRKFRKPQTKFRAVHIEITGGVADVVWIAKRSTILEEKL